MRPPWRGAVTAIHSRSMPRRCASSATGRSTCSSSGCIERGEPAAAPRDTGRDARAAPRPAARAAAAVRRDPRAASTRDVLPFASRDDHPRFFGFVPFAGTWPGALGDLIASACNVYAGSWMESAGAEPGRARGARLVQGLDRLPAGRRRARSSAAARPANLTALACAREALAGPMRDDLVALRLRPGALVGRARRADPRLPARAGARAAERRALPARAPRRSQPRWTPTSRAADARSASSAQGGATNTRRGRPARRARRRSAASTAPGSTSTRPTAASPCSPTAGLLRRARARGLGHARPAQVALPAVRVRLRARPRRPGAAATRSRSPRTTCATPTRPTERGELLRPRPAADPHGARAQGLGLAPLLRPRRVPARRSTARSTSPPQRRGASRRARRSS